MTETDKPSTSYTNIGAPSHSRAPDAPIHGAHVGQNDSARVTPGGSKVASQLADEARGLTSQLAASAEDLAKAQVEKRTSEGADDLSNVARALRNSGKELKGNMVGPYVEKAAEQIDHVADYLRTATPGKMLESVSGFARRDPVLFLSGAFAVGLLGSRFVKSGRAPDSPTPLASASPARGVAR